MPQSTKRAKCRALAKQLNGYCTYSFLSFLSLVKRPVGNWPIRFLLAFNSASWINGSNARRSNLTIWLLLRNLSNANFKYIGLKYTLKTCTSKQQISFVLHVKTMLLILKNWIFRLIINKNKYLLYVLNVNGTSNKLVIVLSLSSKNLLTIFECCFLWGMNWPRWQGSYYGLNPNVLILAMTVMPSNWFHGFHCLPAQVFPTKWDHKKWAYAVICFHSILNRPDLANYVCSSRTSPHQNYFVEFPCLRTKQNNKRKRTQ